MQQLDDFKKKSGPMQGALSKACGLALANCLARASPAHLIIIMLVLIRGLIMLPNAGRGVSSL